MRLRHSVADQQSAEKGACSATIKVRLSDRDGVTMFGLIVALSHPDCRATGRRSREHDAVQKAAKPGPRHCVQYATVRFRALGPSTPFQTLSNRGERYGVQYATV